MIYLDNAATTFPKPKCMVSAMNQCMTKYCGNPGRSGHDMSMKTGEEVYKARKALGELFHIEDPSHIVFTYNATDSLNLAIKGILRPGDHVITTAMEHNSVLRPLKVLEARGVELTVIPCDIQGKVSVEKIKREIRDNTKLIACTHASNVTGTIMPVSEIGSLVKKEKILFLLDASQSAGCIPIDVDRMNIDLLALPGHKGLLGPLGTGILYAKPGLDLRPLKEGGTGTNSRDLKQPRNYPEGFESGTINAPGIIGLGSAVRYLGKIGVEEIQNKEERLLEILDNGIRNIEGVQVYGPCKRGEKTAIVTFNIENMGCEEVSELLNSQYKVACRAGFHCAALAHKTIGTGDTGAVRLSIGPYNTEKEMHYTIQAINKIQKFNH